MRTTHSISSLQKQIKKYKGRQWTIGFVPTMGALHEGHLSLVDKSKKENDITVMSIFVNPTQFGVNEDYLKYPREEKKDLLLAKKRNVDIIFYPTGKIMYPSGFLTFVQVEQLGNLLCGKSRPGHFKGVTTVVLKFLNIVQPDKLYLGQKDYQQAVIVKKMIEDLNLAVKVRVCPIKREPDGLAMSSRNKYLNKQERTQAPVLYRALKIAEHRIRAGERSVRKISGLIQRTIEKESEAAIEYIECVDVDNLKSIRRLNGPAVIALAARFSKTRLIDNIIVKV